MYTRRRLLRECGAGIALSGTVASAGCTFDDESTRSLLAEVADTRPEIVPTFTTAWTCDPQALVQAVDGGQALPALGAGVLSIVEDSIEGTSIADLERLTGQFGQAGGHTGEDVQLVRPTASHALATGALDVDGTTTWLDDHDATSDLGQDRGFHRYGTDGQITEAFVVDESHLGFGDRQGVEIQPERIADVAIDAIDGDDAPVREVAPDLATVADEAGGETFTLATQFDLVAERPDTGTPEYDAVAASLLAAGASATLDGGEATVERLLQYRRDRAPSVADVEAALDRAAAAADPLADADWSVRRRDRTVVAEASVSLDALRDDPSVLRSAFPVPALADVTRPIDPSALGRDPPPRVDWQPEQTEDGRIRIVHGGGPELSDLVVAYTADDERVEERWTAPVESGDQHSTERAPDPGSLFQLVWAQGTPNETILLRIELGE